MYVYISVYEYGMCIRLTVSVSVCIYVCEWWGTRSVTRFCVCLHVRVSMCGGGIADVCVAVSLFVCVCMCLSVCKS